MGVVVGGGWSEQGAQEDPLVIFIIVLYIVIIR